MFRCSKATEKRGSSATSSKKSTQKEVPDDCDSAIKVARTVATEMANAKNVSMEMSW